MAEHIVTVESGKVRGYERDGIIEYLGIPFAEPPVGKLRLKRAVKKKPWEGVFDAKEYGAASVQTDQGKQRGSEDCLTINIQRPLEGEKLPVLVFIHGGGYNTGAASDELLNGREFAKDGILFVAFQYRLNVLGFFDFSTYPGCEEFESNCGLSDQILALQWIHENIAAFGGDPECITIDGESAGAASVTNMLAIPSVRGLFQRAIIQSSLPNCVCTHAHARKNVDLFIRGMGWTEEDLWKLKTIEAAELQKGYLYMAEHHQEANPGNFLPAVVIDDLLPERPIDAIRKGSAEGVQLLIGTNGHEGTMFVHPEHTGFPNSWEMVQEMFEKNGHTAELGRFKEYYGSLDVKEELDRFMFFGTHYAFEVPSVKVAFAQSGYTEDVWLYRYEFISKSGEETGMRASHAFELPLSFKNRDFEFSKFVFGKESEETLEILEHEVHDAWVSFIKTGNPGAEWKRFSGEERNMRIIDLQSRTIPFDRNELMELWGDLRFYE